MASETADATPKRSEAGGPSPRPPDGRPNPYPHTLAPLPDRSGERRVRRGQAPIAARLDLHGHTQATAADALRRFLTAQRGEGARCVLVITGKGRDGEGVLRRRFLQWLETAEAKALASGFAPAHRKHGGGGAWYVFLRRL
ncbi:MAG: Smr/MutS family protein [Pseudomonadota bacterium]